MSVLCCAVPNLLIALACRHSRGWVGRPLALLGPDERVWAVSAEAACCGVQVQMRPQEAQVACPALLLHPLDLPAAESEQGALLAELGEWQLPVEPLGWGSAYVGLGGVAEDPAAVRPLAAEVGGRLRRRLGLDLQPSVGWDSGKFTARAAAAVAAPGRMRLVERQDESRFLGPLSVTLLPLPRPHLQQLHWLGIRTLGQFAALPSAGVLQRFGPAGRQAQCWAQGQDSRPVQAAVSAPPAPTLVVLDPPAATLPPVVEAVMASLRPLLAERAAALEGVRRLRIEASFVAGRAQGADLVFVEPASQPVRVQAALVEQLQRLRWPSELEAVRWTLLEGGELLAPQLTLWADEQQRPAAVDDLARKLVGRYGPSLLRLTLPQPAHPIPERRGGALPLMEQAGHVPPLA